MKYYFLLSIITYISSLEHLIQIPPICPLDCDKYSICDNALGKCVYKGFWPIYPLEFFEIIILSFSSALATTCGIGGGTVYSAFFLEVQNFQPSEAFPISTVLILACGIMTFIVCVFDKYDHPKNKFIDYEMAILFGPSMLLGTKFGTILNKIFSSLFLTIGVLIVLLYSIIATFKVVIKEREAEALLDNNPNENNTNQNNANNIEGRLHSNYAEPLLLSDNINESNQQQLMSKEVSSEAIEIFKEDDNPIKLNRIIFMIILEIFVIIDQFLEGNTDLTSFVGIPRCSLHYWIIFSVYIIISLFWIWIAYLIVMHHFKVRQQVIPEYKTEKMDMITNNMTKIMVIGVIAGTVASMVGIGVGMITNPLFCTLGLNSKEATSTSNFLIITTSIASTFLFYLAHQLNYEFILWMIIPCTVSAYYGSSLVFKYINQTRKSSILLIIMLLFLIASLIIIVIKAYSDFADGSFFEIFALNAYC